MSLSDATGNSDGEVDPAVFAELIACMTAGDALTIIEFGTAAVTRWDVRTDQCGTPHVYENRRRWTELGRPGRWEERELVGFLCSPAEPPEERLLLARAGTDVETLDAGRALRLARTRWPRARTLSLGALSVGDLVHEATTNAPLSQWYELVLLVRTPSGRLTHVWQRLFEPGDRRDAATEFQVECGPSGPGGTTFAVIARDGPSATGLMSKASAKLPRGRYTVTATLRRPGQVRFDGLPERLRADTRTWTEIQASVPERIGEFGPAHLVVAVEACGSDDQVSAHLDRAGQLIKQVAGAAEGPVRYSLLAYSAHPADDRLVDHPVSVRAWTRSDAEELITDLPLLRERARARQDGYTRAASLECMLAEVARLLQSPQRSAGEPLPAGRPVLVTVGSRGPFPASQDPYSDALPCPRRLNWETYLRYLMQDHREMAFGAVCGGDLEAPVWRLLSKDAVAELVAFDAWEFAASLRLVRRPDEHVPFPMAIR